jgi:hypothetical protein
MGGERLPSISTGRPKFGRWAPILTCALWSTVLVGWAFFWIIFPAHSPRTPDTRDYLGMMGFFGMVLATVLLFAAGLIVLAVAGITYSVRLRRYANEQHALDASSPVPPPL